MATGTHELGDYTIEDDGNGDYVIKEPSGNEIIKWDDSVGDWLIKDNQGSTVIRYDNLTDAVEFNDKALTSIGSLGGLSGTSGNALSDVEGANLSVDSSGVLNSDAGEAWTTVFKSADYTPSNYENVIVSTNNGPVTITLPSPADDLMVTIKRKTGSDTVTVTVPNNESIDFDPNGERTIDANLISLTFTSDGSNYFIV